MQQRPMVARGPGIERVGRAPCSLHCRFSIPSALTLRPGGRANARGFRPRFRALSVSARRFACVSDFHSASRRLNHEAKKSWYAEDCERLVVGSVAAHVCNARVCRRRAYAREGRPFPNSSLPHISPTCQKDNYRLSFFR